MPFVLTPTILIYILAAVLGIFIIILLVWMNKMNNRLKGLLRGKNALTLEDSIGNITKELQDLKLFTKEMEEYLTTVETRLKNSLQAVETIRFNPFKGTGSGGNQSFSTSFINEHGDGVVLTSMYTRDRISMFAKPLKKFESEFELSEEELEAIETSKKKLEK
ncbi:MAG: DUF4446 family protein [Patescibacteria group bacterium]